MSEERIMLGPVNAVPDGGSKIFDVGGRSIGVFNVKGKLYAMRNVCPHHGAPLCLGPITGRMLPSEPHEYIYGDHDTVVRCPWHGYEFKLEDGISPIEVEGTLRVKTYRVTAENGELALYM